MATIEGTNTQTVDGATQITITLGSGSIEDYTNLLETLRQAGLMGQAQVLEDTHKTILGAEQELKTISQEQAQAYAVLHGYTIAPPVSRMRKVYDATVSVIDKAATTMETARDNAYTAIGNVKQRFYDGCKAAGESVKQFGHHTLAKALDFVGIKDALNGYADHCERYGKASRICVTNVMNASASMQKATGNFKNVFKSMLDKQTDEPQPEKLGKLAQWYADVFSDQAEKYENKSNKFFSAAAKLQAFSDRDNYGQLAVQNKISVDVKEDSFGDKTACFVYKDIQNVFNAIESDPAAIYNCFKENIDPDGAMFNHLTTEIKNGKIDEINAYSSILYDKMALVNPADGTLSKIPDPNMQQLDTALGAATTYQAPMFVAGDIIPGKEEYSVGKHSAEYIHDVKQDAIQNGEHSKEIKTYADQGIYSAPQLEQIQYALDQGYDVDKIANVDYSAWRMSCINSAFEQGFDVNTIADTAIDDNMALTRLKVLEQTALAEDKTPTSIGKGKERADDAIIDRDSGVQSDQPSVDTHNEPDHTETNNGKDDR